MARYNLTDAELEQVLAPVYEEIYQAAQPRRREERALGRLLNTIVYDNINDVLRPPNQPHIRWDTTRDVSLNRARAEGIIRQMDPNRRYTVQVAFENGDGTVTVDYQPISFAGGKQDIQRTGDGSWLADALMALDVSLWNRLRESGNDGTRIFYELVDYNAAPHALDLVYPLREGEFNCVIQRLHDFFSTGQTKRGAGLADKAEYLARYSKKLERTGCTVADYPALEKALKTKIVVRDLEGGIIWKSDKYEKQTRCEFVAHNGHAWPSAPGFPKEYTEVLYYDRRDDRDAEEKATRKRKTLVSKQAMELASQEGSERIWFLGPDAYVTSAGRLMKPLSTQAALEAAIAKDLKIDPATTDDAKYTAALKDAERQLSVTGWWFRRFHAANGLKPTTAARQDMWRASCVEHTVWSEAYEEGLVQLDMRACFPSFVKPTAESHAYYLEFGLITDDTGHMSAINGEVDANHPAMKLTGTAEVVEWEFREGLHPYITTSLTKHFSIRHWTPTPLLAFLLREKVLTRLVVRELFVATTYRKDITFPSANSDVCRESLGYLTRENQASTVFVRDPGEAAFLRKSYVEKGRFIRAEKFQDWTLLYYRDKHARKTYTHTRASFLSYPHISLIAKLLTYPVESVKRVCTDALYLTADVAPGAVDEYGFAPITAWGEWRRKPVKPFKAAAINVPEHEQAWEESKAAPLSADPITARQVSFLTGQGGCGKTHRAIEAFKGRGTMLVLTPCNDLAEEFRKTKGVDASTYHKFFRYGRGVKIADWTPAVMGRAVLPKVIIWDEICYAPLTEVRVFLSWLRSTGRTVVLCGDPGQIENISENRADGTVYDYLATDKSIYHEEIATDFRAATPALKALKLRMWKQPLPTQLREMIAALPAHSYTQFLAEWHPQDLVMVTTNAMGATLEQGILAVHRAKYPDEPLTVQYRPLNGKMQNIMVPPPGLKTKIMVCRGTIAKVPLAVVETDAGGKPYIKNPNWRNGQWMTVHRAQGRTIEDPRRVWILDDSLSFAENLPYTIVSRVQRETQLRRVVLQLDEKPVWPLRPTEKADKIADKLINYEDSDIEKKRPVAEADRLTPADVSELERKQEGRCFSCKREVLWGGYAPRDPRQFSVDRINNALGHSRQNVRLACFGCNALRRQE